MKKFHAKAQRRKVGGMISSDLGDLAPMRENDFKFMQRAIELAKRGEGLTRPNPPVGAVVVKNGRIIGEGWHKKAGGPHAEIFALGEAGDEARGATIYVTLEPCSTHGRTPPCTDAILAAGISRVVVACKDPNPKHAGSGLKLLEKHGVKVEAGVCADDADALIEPFAKWITKKRPFVTLKLAMTLDGKIADAKGTSRWITGPASRKLVHDLRRRADAIMVGVNTVNADNPSLLPVPARGRKPWRVVLDTQGRIDVNAKSLSDDQTILVTDEIRNTVLTRHVLFLARRKGRVPLPETLRELAVCYNVMHVVCEGGGELAASLIREKLVDELWLFIAPKIIGGKDAKPVIGGAGWLLKNAPEFSVREVARVGEDILVKARPRQEIRSQRSEVRRKKAGGI
jgi:diaminohydroxyphosphoribosylaminopyrimidine deaminase/5-amino-6-(5-phosphoribosylamino)uracil reductase